MELLEKDEEYVISLLKQAKKVEAIAFVKDKTGMTLKEAKDYIDKKMIMNIMTKICLFLKKMRNIYLL